jgi:hypothetical protein
LQELASIEEDLRTSTVSFSKERLRRAVGRLAALVGPA